MASKIVIVNYGMGNLNSVKKMMDRMNGNAIISAEPEDIANCQKIILPGVGHFGKAMENLKKLNLTDVLHEAVLVEKKPVLGICLGMQLMAKSSEEGDSEGLGWFDAEVKKFSISDTIKYKVPHIGWNRIEIKDNCALMSDVPDLSEFYFSHSYHLITDQRSDVVNETKYGYTFVSAIAKDNMFGVQYHPEKSHDAGAQLLKNFIEICI